MAMILITDNPQGVECRCEGQELDLANLSPEQVEALKQALGINANANQGSGQADFSALNPEQVEALKYALGISGTAGIDINALLMAMMNLDEVGLHLDPNRDSYLFNGMTPTLGMALYNIAAKFEELYSIIGRMGESLGQIDDIRKRVDRLESNLS